MTDTHALEHAPTPPVDPDGAPRAVVPDGTLVLAPRGEAAEGSR